MFWQESGYFDATAELKPLLHTWSLAVEEQYYVLFPLFILLMWRFGKRLMIAMLVWIGLISIILAQWGSVNHPSATFYLLPTRLWELLIGSLTAFYLWHNSKTQLKELALPPLYNQVLGVSGLLLIMYSIVAFDDQTPFPSIFTLIPTMGTALIILFATKRTLVERFLSNKLLVGIGLISYSAYLWHQPLFAFARLRSLNTPSNWLMLTLGILSLMLAYLTWKYIEKPFRDKTKFNRREIFQATTVLSVIVISIGITGHLNKGFETRMVANGTTFAELNFTEKLKVNHGLNEICDNVFTTSELCRTDDNPEVVVWGDSFAKHLVLGILASNPAAKIIQMTKSVCGPILGIAPTNYKYSSKWADGCIDFNNSVITWLKNNRSVRYAVLSSPFDQYLSNDWKIKTIDGVVPAETKVALKYFLATLEMLSELGIKPVVVAPPPMNGNDIGNCLAKALMYGESSTKCNLKTREYQDFQKAVIHFLKQVSKQYRVIWISDALCDDATCHAELGGVFVYRDTGHFSREGSAYLGKKIGFYKIITSNP